MKNRFEHSMKNARATVNLAPHEKVKMREALISHMERNPVSAVARVSLFARFFRNPIPAFALCIVLVTGVSTSYAAEAALPGDFLYPVKINVNENLHSAVTLTDEARAEWEVERANRRLEETKQLELKGRLSVEARAEAQARFKAFAERAEERIEKLKAQGKTEAAAHVSTRFETALNAHEAILNHFLDDEKPLTKSEVKVLLERVKKNARVEKEDKEDKNEMQENDSSSDHSTNRKTLRRGLRLQLNTNSRVNVGVPAADVHVDVQGDAEVDPVFPKDESREDRRNERHEKREELRLKLLESGSAGVTNNVRGAIDATAFGAL